MMNHISSLLHYSQSVHALYTNFNFEKCSSAALIWRNKSTLRLYFLLCTLISIIKQNVILRHQSFKCLIWPRTMWVGWACAIFFRIKSSIFYSNLINFFILTFIENAWVSFHTLYKCFYNRLFHVRSPLDNAKRSINSTISWNFFLWVVCYLSNNYYSCAV